MTLIRSDERIEHILSLIFDPEWTGKELKITVETTGPLPKKGRRYIAIFKHPRFGQTRYDNLDEFVKEWRKKVEPYLIHTNHVWYRSAGDRGASKLYLLYDRDLED